MKQFRQSEFNCIKIGTRGSPLALYQANQVKEKLEHLGFQCEIRVIQTQADIQLEKPIHEFGGKGVFAKEIEQALANNSIDIGVHSLKDMSVALQPQFTLAAVLKRDYASDILIVHERSKLWQLNSKILNKNELAKFKNLKIASSSLRRQGLLLEACSEIELCEIRGNIATRLAKLDANDWDGIILSEASLKRLKIESNHKVFSLATDWFIPCAGQGVIAIECLQENPFAQILKTNLEDSKTRFCTDVERQILKELGGDCRLPIGAFCEHHEVKAIILDMQGGSIRVAAKGTSVSELCAGIANEWRKNPDTKNVLKRLGIGKVP